jgi:hypothetical protein
MQSARHSLHIALTPGHLEGYLHLLGMPEIHHTVVFLVLCWSCVARGGIPTPIYLFAQQLAMSYF